MNSCIETYTGNTFDPLDPVFADVKIEDIAHALANQCRFSGHARFHYSVAEHCIRVSELLERLAYSPVIQMWGLMHDASEAYLIDLPSPVKKAEHSTIGTAYREIENLLMAAICRRFGLSIREPHIVKLADRMLLATEVRDLMHGERPYWGKIEAAPLPERIRPWSAPVAEYEYLRRYRALIGDEQ